MLWMAGLLLAACGRTEAPTPVVAAPEPSEPPPSVDFLAPHFPFAHSQGRVQVRSDISPEFSRRHGEHLALVYGYFSRLFARSYGGASVACYTHDRDLYLRILAACATVVVPGGRDVTGCYDRQTGIQALVIVPYETPDFGTQLHEFSHQFLYATWPPVEEHPWFKEGTGMYWESGGFSSAGELIVSEPNAYLRNGISRFRTSLMPLDRLLYLTRDGFYGHADPVRVYAQSGMLVFYLMENHPAAMSRLFAELNRQGVPDNAQLVARLLSETRLTLPELDRAYVAYALNR